MKIPNGLTETQVLEVIEKIVDKLSPKKLIFPGFEFEDIKQEGRIECMMALERFNPNHSEYDVLHALERFLRVHTINRLKNLKRNHMGRAEKPANPKLIINWEKRNRIRRNIIAPMDISGLEHEIPNSQDIVEEVHYNDLILLIQQKLPAYLRSDFLRMLDNCKIPKNRQLKIREHLLEIINDEELISEDTEV